ncbi:hypothetical protein [Vibrio salinus]|uniref:hypothetical protein n=1 Tax=Vibrio salinus TaxID=2899784 RepID=UPI001E5A930A|nr:hypothetical protein [Vibrio salinus]MCE0496313.1 hypothetical protein [Vibrio salinus]
MKAPTITLESTGDDDIYNNAEVGEDGTVTATISLPDDFDAANDTLTITVKNTACLRIEIAAGFRDSRSGLRKAQVTAQITDAAVTRRRKRGETAAAADTEVKSTDHHARKHR